MGVLRQISRSVGLVDPPGHYELRFRPDDGRGWLSSSALKERYDVRMGSKTIQSRDRLEPSLVADWCDPDNQYKMPDCWVACVRVDEGQVREYVWKERVIDYHPESLRAHD